jgi:hypothetical protein
MLKQIFHMKMRAFWDIASCRLVGVDRLSEVRTFFIVRLINLIMHLPTSETSVYSNETNGAISHKPLIFILAAV